MSYMPISVTKKTHNASISLLVIFFINMSGLFRDTEGSVELG